MIAITTHKNTTRGTSGSHFRSLHRGGGAADGARRERPPIWSGIPRVPFLSILKQTIRIKQTNQSESTKKGFTWAKDSQ